MNAEITIHGSMLVLLKKFVDATLGNTVWTTLHEGAGIDNMVYDMHSNYDCSLFNSLTNSTAIKMNLSPNEVKEQLGEFLVPDLLHIYGSHLNPDWKTYQLLENTELVMHKAVRKQENNANPPVLNVATIHDKLIIIDYYSKRKMASLAIGIIRGIAVYYNESESISIIPTTNPDDERVQIRIEFA